MSPKVLLAALSTTLFLACSAAPAFAGQVTVTFTDSGEHAFAVPAGVGSIHVVAIGAGGSNGPVGGSNSVAGGWPGKVSGNIAIASRRTVFATVNTGGGARDQRQLQGWPAAAAAARPTCGHARRRGPRASGPTTRCRRGCWSPGAAAAAGPGSGASGGGSVGAPGGAEAGGASAGRGRWRSPPAGPAARRCRPARRRRQRRLRRRRESSCPAPRTSRSAVAAVAAAGTAAAPADSCAPEPTHAGGGGGGGSNYVAPNVGSATSRPGDHQVGVRRDQLRRLGRAVPDASTRSRTRSPARHDDLRDGGARHGRLEERHRDVRAARVAGGEPVDRTRRAPTTAAGRRRCA